jgi:hypothetical protein
MISSLEMFPNESFLAMPKRESYFFFLQALRSEYLQVPDFPLTSRPKFLPGHHLTKLRKISEV